jgi:hypothetical protein
MDFSNSICFCFSCRRSIFEVRVFKMSVLKSSSRLPSSIFVTPLLDGLVIQVPCLCLATPHEHWMHNSHIASKYDFDMSPFPTIFNKSKEYSYWFNELLFPTTYVVDPGFISFRVPTKPKTIGPSGKPEGNTVHRMHCIVSPEIYLNGWL